MSFPKVTLLAVNQADPAWMLVREYIEARIQELRISCSRLSALPNEREQDAARIAELELMLQSAREAVAAGQGRNDSEGGSY